MSGSTARTPRQITGPVDLRCEHEECLANEGDCRAPAPERIEQASRNCKIRSWWTSTPGSRARPGRRHPALAEGDPHFAPPQPQARRLDFVRALPVPTS